MGSEGREGIRNETTGMIAYIRYIRVFNFIIFSLTSKQAEASLFRKAWCKRAKITCIYIYIYNIIYTMRHESRVYLSSNFNYKIAKARFVKFDSFEFDHLRPTISTKRRRREEN